MTTKGNSLYNLLIINTLSNISTINKWRQTFLLETFILFLSIKGRINFLQLERYGKYSEQRYRQLPSYRDDFIKAGKKTPGLGYFWSGQAGQAKRGLEITGIAAIDIDHHTGFHLEAVQTIIKEDETMLDSGFHFISRLRDDANLKYLYSGEPTGKRGRPKKHGGKVEPNNLDKDVFALVETRDGTLLHTALVYSVSLERNVRIVHLQTSNDKGKTGYKLYFCTDIEMDAARILHYYRSRFQIEFLYRDAKQHTGLNNCQARSENKLHFQFNAALSAINIAKAVHWISIPREQRKAFSMNDIKTMNHNALLLERFFTMFGLNPHLTKNQKHVKELIYYGTIAA